MKTIIPFGVNITTGYQASKTKNKTQTCAEKNTNNKNAQTKTQTRETTKHTQKDKREQHDMKCEQKTRRINTSCVNSWCQNLFT